MTLKGMPINEALDEIAWLATDYQSDDITYKDMREKVQEVLHELALHYHGHQAPDICKRCREGTNYQ